MTYIMTHNIYQLHILMTYIDDIHRQMTMTYLDTSPDLWSGVGYR